MNGDDDRHYIVNITEMRCFPQIQISVRRTVRVVTVQRAVTPVRAATSAPADQVTRESTASWRRATVPDPSRRASTEALASSRQP